MNLTMHGDVLDWPIISSLIPQTLPAS